MAMSPCAAPPVPPPPPPPPPPFPPPAVDEAHASPALPDAGPDAHNDLDEEVEDDEQREFLLHALAVADDWSAHDDGDGRLFYYNRRTRASQWVPSEGFSGLEGELMMKLMLESAVERSGPWTAHATGDGSGALYYFNAKTRASVWEKPSEWGVLPPPPPPVKPQRQALEVQAEEQEGKAHEQEEAVEVADASGSKKKDKKKKKKTKKISKKKEKASAEELGGGLEQQARVEEASKPDEVEKEEEEEEADPEEQEAAKQREEAHMRQIAQFRGMLREKNIMPFCRWSVALPQIAGDPRFMVISTMDERREIFEHFVKHRREDLKAEKKQKLTQAKSLFSELLKEQLQAGWVDAKTTLSVFLAGLEDRVDVVRLKMIQDESLAFLTIDVQEKLYTKAMNEFQAEEKLQDEQAKRLAAFLEKEMEKEIVSWEDPKAQSLVDAFYASEGSATTKARLSAQKREQVFRETTQRLRAASEQVPSSARQDDDRHHHSREHPSAQSDDRRRRDSGREQPSRSRSRSRRRVSRRDWSEEEDRRRRHSSRSRHRPSRSRSHSRSRSQSRSRPRSHSRRRHGRSRHRHRSSSSSRSRSRSHSRRRH